MKRSLRYICDGARWLTVNWRKAKSLFRSEAWAWRRVQHQTHGHRGYLDIVKGTEYAAVTVWDSNIDKDYRFPVYTQIEHIGDDPNFTFYRPEDYQSLPKSVVEDANTRHRAPYRQRMALERDVDLTFLNAISHREEVALKRMAIARESRGGTQTAIVAGCGGFIVKPEDVPSGNTQEHLAAELVAHLMAARAAKDFDLADAIRREIAPAGAEVLIGRNGIEFLMK